MFKNYLVFFILFSFFSCKTKTETISPEETPITESVYASGIIKARNQYQVFSSVNGLIADILVTEGDSVKKGDPIIRLTNTTARLNTENARINADYASVNANQEKLNELKVGIDQAKSAMDNAALLLQRQKNLWAQQIGTRNELDQKELAFTTASHNYESAKLRYAELQKQVNFQAKQSQKSVEISSTIASDYVIKSERNGKVYSMLKEKGELLTTQTPVALIGDDRDFILEIQVDEYDITRVKPGQKILLSMDSYKGQLFEARVDKINPLMNERSKSFTVEAVFVKQPPSLFPNLTCEANIVIQEKQKAITIPRTYLLDGDMVLLENGDKRKVTTGLKDYQRVEILSGLTVKDVLKKTAP
jgi:RND family efflux transporter MFP subunit